MRIVHVDSGREMRGGQWQVLYLSEALITAGHEVKLLARGGLLREARARGLDARPLAFFGWPEADLVHAHDARAHTIAALTRRMPLVVSRRVAFPPKQDAVSRWKYARPAHFIAVSQHVRGILVTAGVPEDRITVVHDGVPLLPPSPGGSRVVAPATGDPMKGSALLREAARTGGFEVVFSRDLKRDLQDAGVFVYLSRSEGLGSAALLAMSAGVPVVASRVGGLAEVVEDGVTGLLVDDAPGAIADAVSNARGNRAMGARGRERVQKHFSMEMMVQGTLAVYDRVLQCSKRR